MVSSFFKYSKFLFLFIFILCIVFIPVLYTSSFSGFNIFDIVESDISSSHDFYWPIPGVEIISALPAPYHTVAFYVAVRL